MENNKYELNSDYVHEIMNDPPKFIIVWGNIIVFALVIISVILLNMIPIKDKSSIEGEILVVSPTSSIVTIQLKSAERYSDFKGAISVSLQKESDNSIQKVKVLSTDSQTKTVKVTYSNQQNKLEKKQRISLIVEKKQLFLNRMIEQLF